jgi:uncharacterized membrane protein (DUF441 family)
VSERPTHALPREVGAGTYVRRVARRWYVVVAAVAIAVAFVIFHGVTGATRQASATATVYLGTPYSPTGAGILPSSPLSNAGIAIAYVKSPQQIRAAAGAAGISASKLRSHVSVLPVGGPVNGGKNVTVTATPTMSITVEGPWTRLEVGKATNSLAQALIDYANRYSNQKAAVVRAKVASEQRELTDLLAAQKRTQRNLARLDASSGPALDRVAATAPYLGDLAASVTQITAVTENLTNDQVGLLGARDIEAAQFLTHGNGRRLAAATRRSSVVVGALIGLILGIALALGWDSLAARRGAAPSPAGRPPAGG